MQLSRATLLALTMLAGCAAAGPGNLAGTGPGQPAPVQGLARFVPTGVYSAFLTGRFAVTQADLGKASDDFLRALSVDPGNRDLLQQAFLTSVMTGRPEALGLADKLADNQIAKLVLGNQDVRGRHWGAAEQKFASLPRQGMTQIMQPILVAWSQTGRGDIDAALATLQPMLDQPRLRNLAALNAGMIADLANRTGDAAKYYALAQADFAGGNLRVAQVLASWQARQGHTAEAQRLIGSVGTDSQLGLVVPAIAAALTTRPVRNATDGIAETYMAMAATLQQQGAGDYAMLLLRLALDMRPDFTSARVLMSELQADGRRYALALATLNAVPSTDPLFGLVRLREAEYENQLGRADQAITVLQQLSRDFPKRAEPLTLIGDIQRDLNRYSEAADAYQGAITRLDKSGRADWRLFYRLGIALERAHNWPAAEPVFERALALAPNEPEILNYLGYSWADQGRNLIRARQMIERAAAARPNDGAIVDSLGWVQLRAGDAPAAVTTLERAVELEPEDPTINGHLGDAYFTAGRTREAEFQWRRALNLHPEPADAAKLEAKLNGTTATTASGGPGGTEGRIQ